VSGVKTPGSVGTQSGGFYGSTKSMSAVGVVITTPRRDGEPSGQMTGRVHALVQNAHDIDALTGDQVVNNVFAGGERAQAWPQLVPGLAQSGTGSQLCTRVADRSEVATGLRTTPRADGVVPNPVDVGPSLWSQPILSHLSSRLPWPR
jgi:hypothetical protein